MYLGWTILVLGSTIQSIIRRKIRIRWSVITSGGIVFYFADSETFFCIHNRFFSASDNVFCFDNGYRISMGILCSAPTLRHCGYWRSKAIKYIGKLLRIQSLAFLRAQNLFAQHRFIYNEIPQYASHIHIVSATVDSSFENETCQFYYCLRTFSLYIANTNTFVSIFHSCLTRTKHHSLKPNVQFHDRGVLWVTNILCLRLTKS